MWLLVAPFILMALIGACVGFAASNTLAANIGKSVLCGAVAAILVTLLGRDTTPSLPPEAHAGG
jgi:hypothetical protein